MHPRFIAFYLPQFHPTELNDKWWGSGYTEWRSVTQAKPLFKGHYQPHEPADLGYYDLRLPEVREQQAEMARDAGIEGFCYWHYWMGEGRVLLERPIKEVLESGKPDFPFCFGWANHNWTNKNWTKQKASLKVQNLVEVKYDKEDYVAHFYHVLPAFKDHRYINVEGKPLFYVYAPQSIPDTEAFITLWQKLAIENGLNGIYFVANVSNMNVHFKDEKGRYVFPRTDESGKIYKEYLDKGYDAISSRGDMRAELLAKGKWSRVYDKIMYKVFKYYTLKKFDYKSIIKNMFVEEDKWENVFPCVIPNWDRSPRAGKNAVIYHNSTPELFEQHIKDVLNVIKGKKAEHQIVFIKSWNEWGEGNHLEPDLKYGHAYLDVIKKVIKEKFFQ